MMDTSWVQQLIRALEGVLPKGFYGSVQVNCQDGGISNVNVNVSVKKEGTGK